MGGKSPLPTLAAGSCRVDLSDNMVQAHQLLSACGTNRTAHSPLEDGTWAPTVAPRVIKAATKEMNRTIVATCGILDCRKFFAREEER